jgi:proteasome component ECM29
MAAAPSTEERELRLVEQVDFQIIKAANNEQKLNELLNKYLYGLLEKAGSQHQSVRNKVIGIVPRLKNFIKPPG